MNPREVIARADQLIRSGPQEAGVIDLDRARELLAEHPAGPILDPNDPRPGAEEYIERHHTLDGVRTLHAQSGVFYGWTGTHYREVEDAEARAQVWEYAAGAFRWRSAGRKEGEVLVPYAPTTAKISNFMDAARSLIFLPAERQAPCWLDGDGPAPASDLIPLQNGLLDIQTRDLLPHTPRLLNHSSLGFSYDPENTPPIRQWLRFLKELWPDDPESIRVLQEIVGYLLTTDTRQQKAFLLVGPKRSGKGTIARIIRALHGAPNVCGPTLAGLSTPFGLQPLIGKPVAIISDARLSSRADQAVIAERILSISGEDAITVDRKHLPSWTGRLPTRFLILTNELPCLADTSGALASRFVVLTLEKSFFGKEDPLLTEKLLSELPGIFEWALDGLDRLTERGHFVQPESSEDAIREMEDLGSPISAFIRERCRVEPGRNVECGSIYEAWKSWCHAEGRDHAGTSQSFARDLKAAVPGVKTVQNRVGGARTRSYEGVDLATLY